MHDLHAKVVFPPRFPRGYNIYFLQSYFSVPQSGDKCKAGQHTLFLPLLLLLSTLEGRVSTSYAIEPMAPIDHVKTVIGAIVDVQSERANVIG